MAFIQDMTGRLHGGGYRYTPLPLAIHYPEQKKAEHGMRMDNAARAYWKKYQETEDRGLAWDIVTGMLTVDERESDEFRHVLWKRRP